MRCVILGAGSVGLRTARVLRDSGQNVIVIEKDEEAIQRASDEGLRVVENIGPLAEALDRAEIESADAFAALTDDLNTNFAACTIAKQANCRTVMRFDEEYGEEVYRDYTETVDKVINPERLSSSVVTNALAGGTARAIADIEENLQLVEFTLSEESAMDGYSLLELELPGNSRLLAYGKAGESLRLPTSNDMLAAGDRLAVLTNFEDHGNVQRLLVGEA